VVNRRLLLRCRRSLPRDQPQSACLVGKGYEGKVSITETMDSFTLTPRQELARVANSWPWWPPIVSGVALLWLVGAWLGHEGQEKEGGLGSYLAGNGCLTHQEKVECARSVWLYGHWWVPPTTLLLVASILWLATPLLRHLVNGQKAPRDRQPASP
jgi:hypothetical protein